MNEMNVVIRQSAGSIDFSNFNEIKESLANKMEEYKNISFNEDSKVIMKGEMAGLRKLKKSINDRKIEVKNAFVAPYSDFEEKVKELIGLIDEPIDLIDKQVKAFDEKQKAEKKTKIKEFFNENVGNIEEFLSLDKIYDTKWENASVTMKSVKDAIMEAIVNTSKAVDTIKSMKSDAVQDALNKYKENLSLTDAISYVNNYEVQKQRIIERNKEEEARKAEQNKQAEIARIREEERQKVIEEQKQKDEVKKKVEEAKQQAKAEALDTFIPDQTEDTSLFEYRIELSKESKETLEMYMDSVGIEWEVI
ncbi:MAG: DUF1351 domain-containing protein [Hespellia sp.]|nr:DUF1351 domain-containing protein [Hespellia sp.]